MFVLYLKEEKNYRDSVDLLRRLIQIAPQHINGLTHLATALMESGEMAEAKQVFLSALEINPSSKIALNNLGVFTGISTIHNIYFMQMCVHTQLSTMLVVYCQFICNI